MHIIPAAPVASEGLKALSAAGQAQGQAATFESVLAESIQAQSGRPSASDPGGSGRKAFLDALTGSFWEALRPRAAQAEDETEAAPEESLAAALAAMALPAAAQPTDDPATDIPSSAAQPIEATGPAKPPVADILEGSLQPPAPQDAPQPGGVPEGERVARMPQQPESGQPTQAPIATDGDSCPLENTHDPAETAKAPLDPAAVQAKIQTQAQTPPETEQAMTQNHEMSADAAPAPAPTAPQTETEPESGHKIQPEGESRPAGRTMAVKPAAEGPGQTQTAGQTAQAEADPKRFDDGDGPEQESAGQKPAAKAETAQSADIPDAGVSRPLDIGALRVQGEMQLQPRPAVTATQQTLMDTMVEQISLSRQDDRHQVEIELRPDYLGKVSIQLTLDGNGLQAKIRAEDPTVRGLIGGQINQLIDALEQKGVRLTEVDMTYQSAQSQNFGQSGGGREQMNQENRNRPMAAQAIAKASGRPAEPEPGTVLTRDTYVATGHSPGAIETAAAYRA